MSTPYINPAREEQRASEMLELLGEDLPRYPFWVEFASAKPTCVMAEDAESAAAIAELRLNVQAMNVRRLPRIANPVLNRREGDAPSFCFKPSACAGKSRCPANPCCSD